MLNFFVEFFSSYKIPQKYLIQIYLLQSTSKIYLDVSHFVIKRKIFVERSFKNIYKNHIFIICMKHSIIYRININNKKCP